MDPCECLVKASWPQLNTYNPIWRCLTQISFVNEALGDQKMFFASTNFVTLLLLVVSECGWENTRRTLCKRSTTYQFQASVSSFWGLMFLGPALLSEAAASSEAVLSDSSYLWKKRRKNAKWEQWWVNGIVNVFTVLTLSVLSYILSMYLLSANVLFSLRIMFLLRKL